jgi:hypothetical protein
MLDNALILYIIKTTHSIDCHNITVDMYNAPDTL